MKLVLSTSNIMTSSSTFRRPTFEKSNTELTSALRANFTSHQQASSQPSHPTPSDSPTPPKPSFRTWTSQQDSALYIPRHTPSPLAEPCSSYDITVKLFYLPNIPSSRRCLQTREAIDLVLRELGTTSIDLLIVSFPGISFDAEDSDSELDSDFESSSPQPSVPDTEPRTATPTHQPSRQTPQNQPAEEDPCSDEASEEDPLPTLIATWQTLETLHAQSLVDKLGLSEFGHTRLQKFLPHTTIRPSVDQINVRDCCVVPKPLILYAKSEGIELLTHNDCTNVLPRGTLREILGEGERGVGVLGAGEGRLRGEVEPQFVVKYTAVVKDRGVVESKGYFAVAELNE